jgi:hypothetical protein
MQNRIFIVVNYYSYNQSFIHLFDFRYFVFSTGTKSSENDRFCPIFVICTGTKTSEKNRKKSKKILLDPGLKSEFLRPKTFFLKTLFMHLRPRLKILEKNLFP